MHIFKYNLYYTAFYYLQQQRNAKAKCIEIRIVWKTKSKSNKIVKKIRRTKYLELNSELIMWK